MFLAIFVSFIYYIHTALPNALLLDPLIYTVLFCLAIFLLCASICENRIYDPGT